MGRGRKSSKPEAQLKKERAERVAQAERRKLFFEMATDGRSYRALDLNQLMGIRDTVTTAIDKRKTEEIEALEQRLKELKGSAPA